VRSHDNGIRSEEEAKWKPQLTACATNRDNAVKANVQLAADLETYKAATAAQKQGVDDLEARTVAVQESVRKMLLDADSRTKKAEGDLKALRSKQASSVIDKNATCEQKLTAVAGALDEAVDARIRWTLSIPDRPPQTKAMEVH
jgi:hypothetical protein